MSPLRMLLLLVSLFLFQRCHPSSEKVESPKENDPSKDWVLTYSDEFDGSGIPDPNKWERPENNRRNNSNGPDGWWLKEDSYLDGKGNLLIRVKRIPNRNTDSDPYDYSSGAIRTRNLFEQKYGKFEIRCKLPSQPGWWVAFWLMSKSVGHVDGSGQDGTEIDIFEGFGWTDKIGHALHWDGYGASHQFKSVKNIIPGIREGFHTFTLEWGPNEYIFLIDNVETWRTNAGGVSKVPAYVKITGEISTQSWAIYDNWANDPAKAVYPDYYVIDYVRVYQRQAR